LSPESGTRPRLLFHVQSLLGIGHLKRAGLLASALETVGFDVTVANGGHLPDDIAFGGARIVQLPRATAADGNFSRLVDSEGKEIDDSWRDKRGAATLDVYRDCSPDVLLLEMYPFGRRAFAFELNALLEMVRSGSKRCRVAVSVRDILVTPSKPERHVQAAQKVQDSIDLVLVHGDPDFIPFSRTFAPADVIAEKLFYTGFVAPAFETAAALLERDKEVLVSAGGGAVGGELMRTAMLACALVPEPEMRWRFLCGPNLPPEDRQWLQAHQSDRVVVESNRGDFQQVLQRSVLSISNAGYNTILDLLQTQTPAVLIPFSGGGRETEQPLRAHRMATLGLAKVVAEESLTPGSLADAIVAALDNVQKTSQANALPSFRLDGAAQSARRIWDLLSPAR